MFCLSILFISSAASYVLYRSVEVFIENGEGLIDIHWNENNNEWIYLPLDETLS